MSYDSRKWTTHLLNIEGSMAREILGRVMFSVVWAIIVVVLYDYGPQYFDNIAIVQTAHSLIGASLGLLLVFRTNSSYDRFWEGRKQWGSIVNESRNLARQAETWLGADPIRARKCIAWLIAFPFATMDRLRNNQKPRVYRGLPAEEVEEVQRARNVPLAVARKVTQLIQTARQDGLIDNIQQSSFDHNIVSLIDYVGACERIRSTPAPFAYVVHLRRALLVYCTTLPLVFVGDYHWETIIVTLLVSYFMFGIEEIGVEIENPFGTTVNDLQLEVICNTINGDLLWIMESLPESESSSPAPELASGA